MSETQSVCKHCHLPEAKHEEWHDRSVCPGTHNVFEPLSEPASTGEPPRDFIGLPPAPEMLYHTASGTAINMTEMRERINGPKKITPSAARPSEPSRPQIYPANCKHPQRVYVAGNTYCEDCKVWLHAGKAAPQKSAEPVEKAYCMDCWHLHQPAFCPNRPQPVSGDAPSPTPSVSTLKREPCFRGCTLTKDRKLCADKSGLMINYCGCDCHDPAAPSVSTEPKNAKQWREREEKKRCPLPMSSLVHGFWNDGLVDLYIAECSRPLADGGQPAGTIKYENNLANGVYLAAAPSVAGTQPAPAPIFSSPQEILKDFPAEPPQTEPLDLAAQGTPEPPKVDIRQKCVNFLCLHPCPMVDELTEFVESLRPYFPPASQTPSFSQLVSIWPAINRFRGQLIDRKISGRLENGDRDILDALQVFANWYLEAVAPRDTSVLEKLEQRLATPASTARTDGPNFATNETEQRQSPHVWKDYHSLRPPAAYPKRSRVTPMR